MEKPHASGNFTVNLSRPEEEEGRANRKAEHLWGVVVVVVTLRFPTYRRPRIGGKYFPVPAAAAAE